MTFFGFRPLTGILFFNHQRVQRDGKGAQRPFPSPYGDFVFQHPHYRTRMIGTAIVSVPLRGFCFSTVPPKSLVIPDLSKPIAERRLKFLFQSAAGGLEWASALVRQGAERMRGFLSDGATIFYIRRFGADSFFAGDFPRHLASAVPSPGCGSDHRRCRADCGCAGRRGGAASARNG